METEEQEGAGEKSWEGEKEWGRWSQVLSRC